MLQTQRGKRRGPSIVAPGTAPPGRAPGVWVTVGNLTYPQGGSDA